MASQARRMTSIRKKKSDPLASLSVIQVKSNNEEIQKLWNSLPSFKKTPADYERYGIGAVEKRAKCEVGDGSTYEGEYEPGTDTKQGSGVQTWPDGSLYQGFYKNN